MPVSRKRKSKKTANQHQLLAKKAREARAERDALAEAQRSRVRRAALAGPSAAELVAGLTMYAADHQGPELEDELCARLGPLLHEWGQREYPQYVGPDDFAVALVRAARAGVEQVLADGADPAAAWRALDAALDILPGVQLAEVDELLPQLRELPGGAEPPAQPEATALAGEVQWARDVYGSRFAVTAPFAAPGNPPRSYLWDIDACTLSPITVRSGYFDSPEEALAAWRADVGELAAGDARWSEVDDASLLEEILPRADSLPVLGGETADQLAEYYRCRLLAEELLDASPASGRRPESIEPSVFAQWYRESASGPVPEDLDELADALAESWGCAVPALDHCCSPHRVACFALIAELEFGAEYGRRVLALLPSWVTWLAGRTGLSAELTARALAYASGEPHPDLGSDARHLDYQAIVAE
ncbi:hypothetical protein JIG36_36760 [Actinoplanes sp. LDG1-06]|uniref:Uncharacterized protein n=1 Tax=Paractinoplanes ovalisporus TaxID=2810368 RepID=A0ABS2AMK5_9ACTN|nr:hypothetical protein [Actinoplanes ovalisporus]MBM2621067.1 hypothetical protein [Actinoplanes ovalisporus]